MKIALQFLYILIYFSITVGLFPQPINFKNPKAVLVNSLRIRKGPSKDTPIIDKLNKGDVVDLIEGTGKTIIIDDQSGEWVKIQTDWFTSGWVFNAYIGNYNLSAYSILDKINQDRCNIENRVLLYNQMAKNYPKAVFFFSMESKPITALEYSTNQLEHIECLNKLPKFQNDEIGMEIIYKIISSKQFQKLQFYAKCGILDFSGLPTEYTIPELINTIKMDSLEYNSKYTKVAEGLFYFQSSENKNRCFEYVISKEECSNDYRWKLYNRKYVNCDALNNVR